MDPLPILPGQPATTPVKDLPTVWTPTKNGWTRDGERPPPVDSTIDGGATVKTEFSTEDKRDPAPDVSGKMAPFGSADVYAYTLGGAHGTYLVTRIPFPGAMVAVDVGAYVLERSSHRGAKYRSPANVNTKDNCVDPVKM